MRCPNCDRELEDEIDDMEDGEIFEAQCCDVRLQLEIDEAAYRGFGVSGQPPVRRLVVVD